ncbi:hypothetical protein [Stenotrophomonas sp. MMGLT7]|uniref:hypothetical protein n=1 Tax=Stenotrophomonas sp. MMGLT7 TaxID=2901227 RepID=UPI001E303ED6|nr:hypothetical protein [Stenotrophomonas sp. MMGLT7]MCD7098069.1 hypothetical protein [Stenotrophomonas sp. MMGLT7]
MRAFALLLILLPCASYGATHSPERTDRMLFVGNSLTYYGNMPAVFSALASANGRPTLSDMIAKGGATLTERVSDGSVARALDGRKYSALVLQERGGDLMCAFGPDSCIQSRQAIQSLAQLASEKGVHVVLLGTYQANPAASRSLVESESAAAAEAGIPHIEVSGKLQRLRATAPELSWFGPDGMHPGKDLALLDAVLVYQALHDSLPEPGPLTVKAPIYGNNSGLTEALRQADAPPPLPSTPGEVEYPADTLKKLLDAMRDRDS